MAPQVKPMVPIIKSEKWFGPINDCFEEYDSKYDCFKSYEKIVCDVEWFGHSKSFCICMVLKGKRM